MKAGILKGDTYKKFKDLILPKVYAEIGTSFSYLVIGLIDDSEPIGALVGYVEDSGMFNIASIYVRPDRRRKGGGMMLIFVLQEFMKTNNIPAALFSYIRISEENEGIGLFFDAIGATERHDLEMLYRVQLWETPDFSKDRADEDTKISVSKLTGVPDDKLSMITEHVESGNLRPKGFDPGRLSLDKGLSFVAFTDKIIEGYLFAYNAGKKGNIILDISFGSPKEITSLLYREFLKAYLKKYPDRSKDIYIPAPGSRVESMINIGDLEKLQYNYVMY